ncbi:MAG: hypothetical protein QOE75_2823 [Solirubrobacterales bacterium]|jgi:hypothetical protein|nr:hypothetical protein [Solirubrobacterales bacterium]
MSAAAPSSSRPLLVGQVRTIAATPQAAGDIPWWARSAGLIAVLPGVAALLVLVALRIVLKALSPSRSRSKSGSLGRLLGFGGGGGSFGAVHVLLAAGLGGMVGYRLGKRSQPVEHSLLMIVPASGRAIPCRYPTPISRLPVASGDRVELLSGRLYPDDTARAWRLHNVSTGVRHRAQIVAGWVPLAALGSLALCLYAAVAVLAALA